MDKEFCRKGCAKSSSSFDAAKMMKLGGYVLAVVLVVAFIIKA